jgi:ABC-2 type transport system permease protein
LNWRKVWTIARTEYLLNVRRAGFLITTAIIPAIGLVALILMAFMAPQAGGIIRWLEEQVEGGRNPIGVVDGSGLFTPILPEYQAFFILYDRPEAAEADLRGGKLQAVLVIGSDYVETGKILALTQEGFGEALIADSTRVRGFLVAHLLNGRVEPSVQRRAVSPMAQLEARVLSGTGSARSGGFAFTFIIPYFLAIFLVMTIFTSSGYLLQSVAEEKENRVVEILVSSVRPTELMAGKVIGLGALGLTQVLVWLTSAWGFSGGAIALMAMTDVANIPIRVLILGVVYYLLGYTLYAVLMAGIGALGTTMRESQQLAGIFSLSPSSPI